MKYNFELFIIKIFLKLTGVFPIAQNILLTNNKTRNGEIISFMYRAFKCRFNTLFIISLSDDLPFNKINTIIHIINKITNEMKEENIIKEIKDIMPCILFLIENNLNNLLVIL